MIKNHDQAYALSFTSDWIKTRNSLAFEDYLVFSFFAAMSSILG